MTADRTSIYVFGQWMGRADLAYCMQNGKICTYHPFYLHHSDLTSHLYRDIALDICIRLSVHNSQVLHYNQLSLLRACAVHHVPALLPPGHCLPGMAWWARLQATLRDV